MTATLSKPTKNGVNHHATTQNERTSQQKIILSNRVQVSQIELPRVPDEGRDSFVICPATTPGKDGTLPTETPTAKDKLSLTSLKGFQRIHSRFPVVGASDADSIRPENGPYDYCMKNSLTNYLRL